MNQDGSNLLQNQPPQSGQPPLQQPSQSSRAAQPPSFQRSVTGLAAEVRDRDTGFLGWWYRATCPVVPPEIAKTLEGKEKFRKARLASLTLLVLCGFEILPIPVAVIDGNKPLLVVLLVTLVVYGIALLCNRKDKLALAGFLTVLVLEVGFVLFFATSPGGLSVKQLGAYDLFLEASLVSVAFFSALSVFLVMGINITIIVVTILILPKSPDMIAFLNQNAYAVFDRPITLQLFGAFVVYVWVWSAYQAILRADRAEEVADLERREIERQEQEIRQKQELDYGIDQILGTLNKLANGETNVKVPLDQNNILWRVGYSINNLLSRIQAFREERVELARTKQAAAALTEALRYGQLPKLNRWTHTCLDELLIELRKVSERQQAQISASASIDRDKSPNH